MFFAAPFMTVACSICRIRLCPKIFWRIMMFWCYYFCCHVTFYQVCFFAAPCTMCSICWTRCVATWRPTFACTFTCIFSWTVAIHSESRRLSCPLSFAFCPFASSSMTSMLEVIIITIIIVIIIHYLCRKIICEATFIWIKNITCYVKL